MKPALADRPKNCAGSLELRAMPRRAEETPSAERGREGFWEGEPGYPQAILTILTAMAIGVVFHLRIGYRFELPAGAALTGGLIYALIVCIVTRRWQTHRLVRWVSGVPFAVTSIVAVGLTAGVGAVIPSSLLERWIGIPTVFRSWIFWMLILAMLTNLLSVTARRCLPLTYRNFQFTLSHLGLILVILGGAWSGASLERSRLVVSLGNASDTAQMENGRAVTLPFTLQLREFTLESFPPTLALATLDERKPDGLAMTPGHQFVKAGMRERIGGYHVEVKEYLPRAALVGDRWHAVPFSTSAPAARIAVTDRNGALAAEGWVSCGGLDTDRSLVQLSPTQAIVMPKPRPREYRATLQIAQGEQRETQLLRVNYPLSAGDYRLYLLSYDETMGSASEYVVVEAVRDHGLPMVYAGMFLLLGGAALMLWNGIGQPKGKETRA
jgi:hypothetical protein